MKIISISVQPARSGTDSRITQKTPSVARLEKNIPIELMMKSARYCMRALMYWVSMMKYRRRYSASVRILASRNAQDLDRLVIEHARKDKEDDRPGNLHEQHGQKDRQALARPGDHHQRCMIDRLERQPVQYLLN